MVPCFAILETEEVVVAEGEEGAEEDADAAEETLRRVGRTIGRLMTSGRCVDPGTWRRSSLSPVTSRSTVAGTVDTWRIRSFNVSM